MPIHVVLAALAVGAAIPLLWFSVASARSVGSAMLGKQQVGEIRNARDLILTRGAGERIALPALRNFGATLRKVTPLGWVDSLRRNLSLAGVNDPSALERSLVGKFAIAGVMFAVGVLWAGGWTAVGTPGLGGRACRVRVLHHRSAGRQQGQGTPGQDRARASRTRSTR